MSLESEKREFVRRLLEAVLSSFAHEYKDFSDTWRSIETKAQGVATVAAAFLAGALTLLTRGQQPISQYISVALWATVVLCCFGVACAVLALLVRNTTLPPIGTTLKQFVDDVLGAKGDDFEKRELNLLHDQIAIWDRVCKELLTLNKRKACALVFGQVAVLLAIAPILFAILSTLILSL